MGRIAKKPRSVKRQKAQKAPPRYTIRKDALGRRYAIDKRNGKRVSLSKADNERAKRRQASKEVFRGIRELKPLKPQKAKTQKQKRSEAAKKGWETRRKREKPPITERTLKRLGREVGAFIIPEGMRMHIVGGIADRSEIYPKVKIAADLAYAEIQSEFYNRQLAVLRGKKVPPPTTETPKFDKHHGAGMGQLVRDHLAGAMDLADIDQLIEQMAEDPDYDFDTRELYTLYFSPQVA